MMKKYGVLALSVLLLLSLSGCQSKKSIEGKKDVSDSDYFDVEDTSEVAAILEKEMKRIEKETQEKLKAKQNRIKSGETMVDIDGEIVDLFNKPDSGFDFYQVTLKVTQVENDPNKLYEGAKGKEYIYFVSPSENSHVDFTELKKGDKVKISAFQDSYVTEGAPKQTSEEDVTNIEIIN